MGFFDRFKGKRQEPEGLGSTPEDGVPDMVPQEPKTLGEATQQALHKPSDVPTPDESLEDNEGLPSVNRRRGNNTIVNILGVIVIIIFGAAMIVAVNGDDDAPEKDGSNRPEQVANNLPAFTMPKPTPPTRPAYVAPRSQANNSNTSSQPGGPTANGKQPLEWWDRKLGGSLVLATTNGSTSAQPSAYQTGETRPGQGGAVPVSGASLSGGGDNSALGTRLQSTQTDTAKATLLTNRDFLITKGTPLDCALETAIDSTLPGITTCRLTRDIYSDNSQVKLLDRGTQLVGEYQGGLKQGQARIFVLWTRAKTPNGVVVNLNSPGTDALGRGGLDGWVDTHFMERFGAAIMFSLMQDSLNIVAASQKGDGGTVVYGNTSQAGEQFIGKILDSTINIPPTLVKNQGDHIQIMVARDLDFSDVYALQAK